MVANAIFFLIGVIGMRGAKSIFNVTVIFTSLVLINPLNLPFLNTSGLVRGFGVTLLIGVLISLFTGVIVTRTLLRLFLKEHSLTK